MKIVFSLWILLLYACSSKYDNTNKSKTNNNSHEVESSNFKKERLKQLNTDKGIYSFLLKNDTTLTVFLNNQKIQELKTKISVSLTDFYISDWNFDGYDDLFILVNQGNTASAYQIWNYEPASGKFQLDVELSDEMGLEKDDEKKQIIIHYREGWQLEYWRKYKFKGDSMVFINQLIIDKWIDKNNRDWIKKTKIQRVNKRDIVTIDSFIFS
jgi:hypothetical protein